MGLSLPRKTLASTQRFLLLFETSGGMKSLERFNASDLLSPHVPSFSNTVSGDTVHLQTDIESLLTSCATLKSRKAFFDCVWGISRVKSCYSDLKLGKLAISAEFQSHCREGVH